MLSFVLVALGATTSPTVIPSPRAVPPPRSELPPRARPPGLGPPELLVDDDRRPRLRFGAAFRTRFGVGDDAVEDIRADPPYALVVDVDSTARYRWWLASVNWAIQIAGPEASPPNEDSRQVFQFWELGLDLGARFRPSERSRIKAHVGVRGQPRTIGPSLDSQFGALVDVRGEYALKQRGSWRAASSLRVVGRTGAGKHDRGSPQRLRRSTCFLWGPRFLDCTLAFTLLPGTVGAEGDIRGRWGGWDLRFWGGWFVAARAPDRGQSNDPVSQESGDWTWLGLDLRRRIAQDFAVSASVLTGGRLRDGLNQARIPLFSSDLARTTFVITGSFGL